MITLEERLQRAAEILDREAVEVPMRPPPRPARAGVPPRRLVVQVAAACIVVVGLVGTVWALSRSPSITPLGPGPEAADTPVAPGTTMSGSGTGVANAPATIAASLDTIPPAATLPPMPDLGTVPVTVRGTGPTDWYRLQPDLDVAWYSDGTTSWHCFRTPAGSQCLPDPSAAPGGGPIGVQSVDAQVLIVTIEQDGRERGELVEITFDDGTTVTAPVENDVGTGWGVARIQAPDGFAPVDLALWFEMSNTAPTTVPGDVAPTAPPATASTEEPPDTAPATTGPTTPTTPAG